MDNLATAEIIGGVTATVGIFLIIIASFMHPKVKINSATGGFIEFQATEKQKKIRKIGNIILAAGLALTAIGLLIIFIYDKSL